MSKEQTFKDKQEIKLLMHSVVNGKPAKAGDKVKPDRKADVKYLVLSGKATTDLDAKVEDVVDKALNANQKDSKDKKDK